MKGMGTDEKIGQNPLTLSTSFAIGRMRDSGRVGVVCRERDNFNADLLEPAIEFVTMPSLRHQLSVNGGRDDQGPLLIDLKEQRFRPIGMLGIVDEHIQQDTGVQGRDHRPRTASR